MSNIRRQKQARKKRVTVLTLTLALTLTVPLVGCGKKPGYVDPPPEVTNDNFPLIYPDPATDPKPEPGR
jgi:hypothetical protein